MNPDGTGFTVLHHFAGGNDGSYPYGGLVLVGSTLYGTTTSGGPTDSGTLFKINTDGSGYAVLHTFSSDVDGASPNGTLVVSGSSLYGVANYSGGALGGPDTYGTVFKINTDGSGFAVLRSFSVDPGSGSLPNGANPRALLLSGTTLYGVASSGGTTNDGVLFKLQTDGTGFAVVLHFDGTGGTYPTGDLILSGGTLYGTTEEGGAFGGGTVFKVGANGSGFGVLRSLGNGDLDAAQPGGLVLVGSTLYGTAGEGGAGEDGAIFQINTDGSGYAILRSFFGGADGQSPRATLASTGATLYGVTEYNGAGDSGVLFQLNTDGSGFGVVHAFSARFRSTNVDGAYPGSGLVSAGGSLYGTTSGGGAFGWGDVFKTERDGSGFTVLRSFTGGLDGGSPEGRLALLGNTLYGTTSAGGGNGTGTIFKINPDGTGFAVLRSFGSADPQAASEGVFPSGGLIGSGTVLYGTLRNDGAGGAGSVYKINTDGTGFTVLRFFARDAGGGRPQAGRPRRWRALRDSA